MPLISSLGVMNAINFGLASSFIKKQSLLVAAVGTAIKVYPFSTTGSVGTLQGNVDTSAYWTSCATAKMSNDGSSVAAIGSNANATPFLVSYPYSSLGFGTKFTNPTQPAAIYTGTTKGLAFNSSNTKLIVPSSKTPFIQVYNYSNSSGIQTLLSNPTTLPPGAVANVKLSKNEDIVAFASNSSPWVGVYAWSNSTGLGTKYANPSTLPTAGYAIDCDIGVTDASNYKIAIAMTGNPNLNIYNFNITTGFGTVSTGLVGSSGYYSSGLAFSKSGINIVCGIGTATNLRNVRLTGTSTYTFNLQSPSNYLSTDSMNACFNSTGNFVAIAGFGGAGASGAVEIYNFLDLNTGANSWGTRVTNSLYFTNTSVYSVQILN